MPCRCDDFPQVISTGISKEEYKKLKAVADKATRAACDMRTTIRQHAAHLLEQLTPETLDWIQQHDEVDRKRIEKETASKLRVRVKRQALQKLTDDEKILLGIVKGKDSEALRTLRQAARDKLTLDERRALGL